MITGILLAAGKAGRFGSNKLVYPLSGGVSMAAAAARALSVVDEVVAVVSDARGAVAGRLREGGVRIVECPHAHDGMGSSLACGIAASPEASGWLVALADMPFVRPVTVAMLADALRRGVRLVAPIYQGRRGHPVGFAREFAPALLALNGDTGARSLLEQHAASLRLMACDDPGTVIDIDTPTDLARAGATPHISI